MAEWLVRETHTCQVEVGRRFESETSPIFTFSYCTFYNPRAVFFCRVLDNVCEAQLRFCGKIFT